MHIVYLHTGSNVGNRQQQLEEAVKKIEIAVGKIVTVSSIYETSAWGNTDQADFLNQAVAVQTTLSPQQVLEQVLAIEHQMGRVRHADQRWQPRAIDIDILLFGELMVIEKNLTIPHPELHKRNFVLVPLMEIAPELLHPVFQKAIEDIYFDCEDECDVLIYEP